MAAGPREAKDTPLAGVRVVEMSHVLAAPTCGLMLADLGAEVIKVERPPRGDTQRWDTAEEDRLGRESASFVQVNRGKKSVWISRRARGKTSSMNCSARRMCFRELSARRARPPQFRLRPSEDALPVPGILFHQWLRAQRSYG